MDPTNFAISIIKPISTQLILSNPTARPSYAHSHTSPTQTQTERPKLTSVSLNSAKFLTHSSTLGAIGPT